MKEKTLTHKEVCAKGGTNRWKDIPEEERSRIMKEAVMKRKYRPVKQLPQENI